jgi:type I restriction-modification system DNA methylase subunit
LSSISNNIQCGDSLVGFDWKNEFPKVFESGGFDVIIGNPPYVSTKKVGAADTILFQKALGFSDDTYNHFFFNGKYIAVRKSTKWAKHIQESRPEKSAEAIKAHRIPIDKIANFSNTADYLASLTEKEITTLFDELKELYGRDIFHFRAGVCLPPYLTTAKLLM